MLRKEQEISNARSSNQFDGENALDIKCHPTPLPVPGKAIKIIIPRSIPEEFPWNYRAEREGQGTTDLHHPLGMMLIVLWVSQSIKI